MQTYEFKVLLYFACMTKPFYLYVYETVRRQKTSKDPEVYKNSVITFLKVEEKRYRRYLRTKKILYKAE